MTFRWMPEARILWENWKLWNTGGELGRPVTAYDLIAWERMADVLAGKMPTTRVDTVTEDA